MNDAKWQHIKYDTVHKIHTNAYRKMIAAKMVFVKFYGGRAGSKHKAPQAHVYSYMPAQLKNKFMQFRLRNTVTLLFTR